nr:hypothetical protein DGKKSRWO_DGKKSRWO_CDS_0126 [uncultured phage]CAI9752303.1 hypothetical protein CVNMHQAP_CVNMHQAP_CDS_0126 [uncultured phage]
MKYIIAGILFIIIIFAFTAIIIENNALRKKNNSKTHIMTLSELDDLVSTILEPLKLIAIIKEIEVIKEKQVLLSPTVITNSNEDARSTEYADIWLESSIEQLALKYVIATEVYNALSNSFPDESTKRTCYTALSIVKQFLNQYSNTGS